METKNNNETSKNNLSYYLGIWNSDKWEKADLLLKKRVYRKNYNELFTLYSKYKKIPNPGKINKIIWKRTNFRIYITNNSIIGFIIKRNIKKFQY